MMNEPHRGYIELPSMHAFDYNTDLHLAHVRMYSLQFQDKLHLLKPDYSFCPTVLCSWSWPRYARAALLSFVPHAEQAY